MIVSILAMLGMRFSVVRSLQPNTIAIAELPRISLPNLASGKYAWRIYSKEERVLLPKHVSWSLGHDTCDDFVPDSRTNTFLFQDSGLPDWSKDGYIWSIDGLVASGEHSVINRQMIKGAV